MLTGKVALYWDAGSADPGSAANFWLCICIGDPYFVYRLGKRYFFLILKIHFVDL